MAVILVVEDEDRTARAVSRGLRKAGHTPIVAPDGDAALRAAATQPDLILLDLGLPDISGADVLRRLKHQRDTAQIPVVVLSSESDAAARVADLGARAVAAVLRKPVLFPELRSTVDAVLNASAERALRVGTTAGQQRVRLILRLITEGSDQLARQVCDRLDADRGRRERVNQGRAPSWVDLARVACQEGLLSDGEGALLAECSATPVHAH